MPVEIELRPFVTGRDFFDYLLALVHGEDIALARGQSDGRDLKPSVWRGYPIVEKYRLRTDKRIGDDWHLALEYGKIRDQAKTAMHYVRSLGAPSAHLRALIVWLNTEIELVRKFCSTCDRIALPVPGYSDAGSSMEIDEENEHGYDIPVYRLGPVFAFAQHNRIPTRLLDFSDSPLKAAYFAVEEATIATEFCVWVLRRPKKSAPDTQVTQEFRALRSQIPFLHAQDGLFLSCNALSNRFFLENGHWPKLEQVIKGWRIEKLLCPGSEARQVKRWLKDYGISEVTMKPSYENVVRHIIRTKKGKKNADK